jgi:hypothetical protein
MTPAHASAAHTRVVKIGADIFLVYGDDFSGWSLDPRDLYSQVPQTYRYGTFEELFFALVNMSLHSGEGQA